MTRFVHSFEEWLASELFLYPIQVAAQLSLTEVDDSIEPIMSAVREGAIGRSFPLLIV